MIALIDADVLAYRIAFACEDETVDVAKHRLSNYIATILACGVDRTYEGCFVDQWKLYLTGKGNFRESIAITAPYKGNRTAPKPAHHQALRNHLVDSWDAVVYEGIEADDAIATDATTYGEGNCIMVSVDKDFDQIAGWHFNFIKNIGYYITEEQGLCNFYKQILTGDTSDNIMGLKGIGPVKADKLLMQGVDEDTRSDDLTYEENLYCVCLNAYNGNATRVLENARLLWLWRKPNQMWLPPGSFINFTG